MRRDVVFGLAKFMQEEFVLVLWRDSVSRFVQLGAWDFKVFVEGELGLQMPIRVF